MSGKGREKTSLILSVVGGNDWRKVRLVAQGAPRLRKVRPLRKWVRLCANVLKCAQTFVEARKVFPLHHPPLKAQLPDAQGSVDEGIVVGIPSVQR
jgi:hypothetical protein